MLFALAQTWLAASVTYLLGLTVAALRRGRSPEAARDRPIVVCLVPAHNEADGLQATVASLLAQDYPSGRHRVVVVADNCDDATAEVAARSGATVWERVDAQARGKGHALDWALTRMRSEMDDAEVVVMVDADCVASQNLVRAIVGRLATGAGGVQAAYRVSNAGQSPEAALRAAGFHLMHDVRAAGKSNLGLSCGLFGTGMGFTADTLREHQWRGSAMTEDTEYHLELVRAGLIVQYAPEAWVMSAMPVTAAAARSQHLRWEGGNVHVARRQVGRLLIDGLGARDPQLLSAAAERFVPAQSFLAAGGLVTCVIAALAAGRARLVLAVLTVVGQVAFVVVGLRVARAPRAVWRALAFAPGLVYRRLRLAGSLAAKGTPLDWQRTRRDA